MRKYVSWGAGPRASQYLVLAAKARAVLAGRYAVGLEDVRALALPVLMHRVVPNFHAEADGVTARAIVNHVTESIQTGLQAPGGCPSNRLTSRARARSALDPVALASLASLSIRARVIVEGAFSGMHHNLHAGTSMEFTEHKEYSPGDEIRRIDWKAVGRVDRYYIKRFEDETEMRTYLVVDASASMGYARRGVSKLTYAGYLAGALAYLLGQQGDPAGLLLFDDQTRHYLPPSTRSGQVREIFRLLETAPAGRAHRRRPGARPARRAGRQAQPGDRLLRPARRRARVEQAAGEPSPSAPAARGAVAERLAKLVARAATTWSCSICWTATRSSCPSRT